MAQAGLSFAWAKPGAVTNRADGRRTNGERTPNAMAPARIQLGAARRTRARLTRFTNFNFIPIPLPIYARSAPTSSVVNLFPSRLHTA